MQITILGSAAAEAWPAPFCLCPNCQEARRRGGTNIRSRSGVLIDDDLKIDFGPDTTAQMQRTGRTLAHLKTLLFTHQHSDHLTPAELAWVARPFTQTEPDRPIELFANAESLALIHRQLDDEPNVLAKYQLREIKAGDHFRTAAGDEVWAMRADHVQGAMIFRIRRGGKVFLHGHDTGLLTPEALERLSDGVKIDVALLDCTNGPLELGDRGHMGVSGVVKTRDELHRRGALADSARIIATHFSHNGGSLHEELVRAFLPHRIEVAFDGMTISP